VNILAVKMIKTVTYWLGSKRLETSRHSVVIGGTAAAGGAPKPATAPSPRPGTALNPRPAVAPSPSNAAVESKSRPGVKPSPSPAPMPSPSPTGALSPKPAVVPSASPGLTSSPKPDTIPTNLINGPYQHLTLGLLSCSSRLFNENTLQQALDSFQITAIRTTKWFPRCFVAVSCNLKTLLISHRLNFRLIRCLQYNHSCCPSLTEFQLMKSVTPKINRFTNRQQQLLQLPTGQTSHCLQWW
jgi:hypothetical protein